MASWEEKLAEGEEGTGVEGENGGDCRGVVARVSERLPRPRIRPRFVTARILPRAPRKNLHANSVANPGQRARSNAAACRNQFCGLALIIECGVNK